MTTTSSRRGSQASEIRYVNDVQERLVRVVDELQRTVQQLALSVRAVETQMPTRMDIQREVEKRLPTENFILAHSALEKEVQERYKALERDISENHHEFEQYVTRAQGSLQRAAPWVSMFVGGGVGCFSLLVTLGIAGVSAVFYLAQHLH